MSEKEFDLLIGGDSAFIHAEKLIKSDSKYAVIYISCERIDKEIIARFDFLENAKQIKKELVKECNLEDKGHNRIYLSMKNLNILSLIF